MITALKLKSRYKALYYFYRKLESSLWSGYHEISYENEKDRNEHLQALMDIENDLRCVAEKIQELYGIKIGSAEMQEIRIKNND